MQPYFQPYKQSVIGYYRYGTGPKWVCCLHGYGESGKSFEWLEGFLGKDYTLIAIDFPFHGDTSWKEEAVITAKDLLAIIQSITQQTQLLVSLLGYSMGGRVALQLAMQIPQNIERLVLVAPDGLHENFWYRLATQTSVGNAFFRFTMRHPAWFLGFIQLAGKTGLLHKTIVKTTLHYIDTATKRTQLYQRWTAMHRFRPNLATVKHQVARYHIPVRLLFGSYDQVIRSKRGVQFRKGIENQVRLQVIQAGHQLLKEKYGAVIAKQFYE